MLIAIEGIDCSGKGTQSRLVAQRLGAALFSFPAYHTPLGEQVRKYLRKEDGYGDLPPFAAAMLYAVDRAQFRRQLEAKDRIDVVCDRYVASNAAYHSCRPGAGPQFDRDVYALEHGTFGLPRADLYILIDVPAEVAVARLEQRGKPDAHERLDFLRQVAEKYRWMAHTEGWPVFDGDRPVEAITADILRKIEDRRQIDPQLVATGGRLP